MSTKALTISAVAAANDIATWAREADLDELVAVYADLFGLEVIRSDDEEALVFVPGELYAGQRKDGLSKHAAFVVRQSMTDGDEDGPLYWNNQLGWGDVASATVFLDVELEYMRLPLGGVWEELPDDEAES